MSCTCTIRINEILNLKCLLIILLALKKEIKEKIKKGTKKSTPIKKEGSLEVLRLKHNL